MLRRRFGLLQAVSLNMSMMVGIGPFITIPTFVAKIGGPHALIGWILGAILALADGLIWSELASRFPGSGGTYHFYNAAYGESRIGRLLRFLFVWQFLFSGPLEIASGGIGLSQYVSYFIPSLSTSVVGWGHPFGLGIFTVSRGKFLAVGVLAAITALAYRRIDEAGRLMVILWLGMLLTVGWVIVCGLSHFDSSLLLDLPTDAWEPSEKNLLGLGMALSIAMYDFLGYYQVCYLGDEVANPAKTIPRSILISVVAIATAYLTMNASILGVIPWREVVESKHLASDLMRRIYGVGAANLVTLMIIWTAGAATFAAILSYSRIPYASARAGHFYRAFAELHPTKDFPHRSLLMIGGLAMFACLFELGTVIEALIASRILIQFVGQIITLFHVRRHSVGDDRQGFRMPLYPIPAVVALIGWLFVFGSSGWNILAYAVGTLALGVVAFLAWDRTNFEASLDPRCEA
jgi:amino acid transporter